MAFPSRVETARLVLLRPRIEDLPAYDRLLADPRVPEHQFPARFRTPEFNEMLLQKAIDHWAEYAFGPWNLWLGDELIGRAGVINSTFEGRDCVEAKWFLSPDHWGQGYATEAARAAIDAAFAFGIEEILAWTMTTNLPSQAVMARLGFEPIGEIDRAGLPHVAFALKR
jgi:RimJ/RimL family protein N-acetyltransferase